MSLADEILETADDYGQALVNIYKRSVHESAQDQTLNAMDLWSKLVELTSKIKED